MLQYGPIISLNNDLLNNDYLFGQYNLVSTALTNFLPSLPIADHANIYEEILFHKRTSAAEQLDLSVLDRIIFEGHHKEALEILRSQPAIICTYHTGSYRMLNLYLTQQNIPFTVVLSSAVLKSEQESLIHQASSITGKNDNICVGFIAAEEPNALLQMIRTVKQGRSLVLYIDGNTGSGINTSRNDNSCVVHFLNSSLYARKGIAFLAARLQVPLIAVANYRTSSNQTCMRFFKPCFVSNTTNSITAMTQQLYDNISSIVADLPGQWEAWLYIHKVAIPNAKESLNTSNTITNNKDHYVFNPTSYAIMNHLGDCFLIDKLRYAFYTIDKQLYQYLKDSFSRPVSVRNIDAKIYYDLLKRKVIIPVGTS